MSRVKISPVSFVRGKPDAAFLVVTGTRDDFAGTCSVVWQVFAADKEEPYTKRVREKQDDGTMKDGIETLTRTTAGERVSHGQITIAGDDYANWDGNNNFPAQYVAKQLDLSIIS